MNDTTRTSTASRPAADHLDNLHHAFELVQDPADWKAPIDRTASLLKVGLHTIPAADRTTAGAFRKAAIALVKEAVIHFTGTTPVIVRLDVDRIHVKAWGYRLGPCGDR